MRYVYDRTYIDEHGRPYGVRVPVPEREGVSEMSEKHTPGPWEAAGRMIQRHTPGVFIFVAEVVHSANSETDQANARLIAAAPEMRDLLCLTARTMGDCERHGLVGPMASGDALLSLATDVRALLARIDGQE